MADGLTSGAPRNSAAATEPPGDRASEDLAHATTLQSPTVSPTEGTNSSAASSRRSERRFAALLARIGSLVRAIQDNDEAKIEEAILRLSESRRVFAPLAFAVGAFVMLFNGLRLLVTNWRLTLVQILPAMWIWLAMIDLKAHTLHGKSFTVVRGPILIPAGLLIIAITVASFFLNAVFAFAVSQPGRPEVRPAIAQAREHLKTIMAYGVVVGALLAFSTIIVTRWGKPWFTISLGIVVGADDGLLRGRPRAPDRLKATQAVQTRQACEHRSRRRTQRDRVHAALPPRAPGNPGARIKRCSRFHSRHLRPRAGSHPPSRRHRRGQGDQDERNPHRSAPSQRRASEHTPDRGRLVGTARSVESSETLTASEIPRRRGGPTPPL